MSSALNGFLFEKYGATYSRTQFTDGHIEERYLAGIPYGLFAARPSASILTLYDAGLPYLATDTNAFWQWTGAAWEIRLIGSSTGNSLTVAAKTNGSGSPYGILTSEVGTCFTNEGATAEVYLQLPSAAAGLHFEFICQDQDGMRIVAAAGDVIRMGYDVTTAGGYVKTSVESAGEALIGSVLALVAINDTEWIARWLTGMWESN